MFHSPSGLPHILAPNAYRDPAWFERERTGPLARAWHLVGIADDFKNNGDFITLELLGHPLLVRRFDEQIVAVSNVCSHRHCLISSKTHGRSDSVRCQYHGWEFGPDGYTRKIPCAKDLAPINREQFRLKTYRAERCGQLIFVCLSNEAPDLDEYLSSAASKFRNGFGDGTSCFMKWTVEYDSNWKVAIENSLEAYHVQTVHPNTFVSDPGEQRSEHILEERHSAFGSDLPFVPSKGDAIFQACQSWVLRRIGMTPTHRYWQHHVFPNLLSSYTDAIRLVHCVLPLSPTRSRSVFYQFGVQPAEGLFLRSVTSVWGKFEAWCTRQILEEDIEMYPRIQKGLNVSEYVGRLARSEERIHRFQEFWAAQMSIEPSQFREPEAHQV